ncbi:NfeD family protein [Jeotgalibacillus haloalkalitolerans]|uniref:Nodulation protein NfeD n=1 Tax=Jeotgalibacillus haloalkalitolerans TaxID=3104292 RepID=A0ABU5KMB8_9BACL|nr:nodulation protein NfeD [Jeotgalibacillus sp. HH7-29]MDZ5712213.1 nodulation protein NfeD [Jeotgalibacillus sp. HH7-29]
MKTIGVKLFAAMIVLLSVFSVVQPADANAERVYVAPVKKEVERGLASFLERSIEEAEENDAEALILDINTPGGAVNAAEEIGEIMLDSQVDLIAYINPNALSAGSYIALYADEIYMSPSGKMGASAVITSAGGDADRKAQSAWLAAMINAAESSDKERDPIFAEAMVDQSIEIPGLVDEGELLTFTPATAEENGYSEGTFESLDELIASLGYEDAEIVSVEPTFTENLARFVTNPIVVPILLSMASLGLVLELYSPGFGIAGSLGLGALLLFFFGHLIAGLAGMEVLILFLIGVGLVIAEFFVPGGILGIAGLVAIVVSILLAGESIAFMGIALSVALLAAVIGMVIMVKFLGKNLHLLKKIILSDSTNTESGYVSNINRHELIGQTGITRTALRPSGTIIIENERIDAVSEGSYINKDQKVLVVKVEGSRIVVREVD